MRSYDRGSYPAWSAALALVGMLAGAASPAIAFAQPVAQVPAPVDVVRAWEEPLTLPTYLIGPPDPHPMFFRNEVYQGAKKKIYPYAFQDTITRDREGRTYTAVRLENEYVSLTVLPELGGRLFSATDRTNGYEFFYRQTVIKPALIGMLGAWISGGIEWCVFHHHRNTTFMPVDYTLTEQPDGSKTIWVGETERRHRMKWVIGLTLHPGRSDIETTVRFFNRTPFAHSILYWANVAVHVNDDYQTLFPGSVEVAAYHSKNEFVAWPIATGAYRGVDYEGVDLSRWPNHPEPTSFFAWHLRDDFSGGYDHREDAGVVHVGNHHIVAGTKLWEWGPGPRGRLWDDILTDEDGPYAELMVGAFSDNQPDYSWIGPHETKSFAHHWYPIRDIGGFTQANLEAAVNLELNDGIARVGVHATSRLEGARVILTAEARVVLDRTVDIDPGTPFLADVDVGLTGAPSELELTLQDASGGVRIRHRPAEPREPVDLPAPAEPPAAPQRIDTIDELYLTGLRLQQMHSPIVPPEPYFEEALRRDPGDVRVNTIVGSNLNQRGLHVEADRHLRTALERLTAGYIRPGNTEAEYQLGIALRGQGRLTEAYARFYRAAWDGAHRSAAYYQLAELSGLASRWARALEEIDESLATNGRDTRALGVRAIALRHLGRGAEADVAIAQILALDPIDVLAHHERWLGLRDAGPAADLERAAGAMRRLMRDDEQSYLELASDYAAVGLWGDGIELLERLVDRDVPFASTYPLVHYYLGYFHERNGDPAPAREAYGRASEMPPDFGFPFRLESIQVLEAALAVNPEDHRAHYYLGNLLFEIQPERAIDHWERSRAIDDAFSIVHRNLGWAYYRTRADVDAAIASYERAVAASPEHTRLSVELDELYEAGNAPLETRLALVRSRLEVVARHSDSLLRALIVDVLAGEYDRAIEILESTQFFVAEGGGRVRDVFVDAHLLRGLARLDAGRAREALGDFQAAGTFPRNLSVARPSNDRRAPQVAYYTARAHEALGEATAATAALRLAADQQGTERWPDTQVYQALAFQKLGVADQARELLDAIERAAGVRLAEDQLEFFATFGTRSSQAARRAQAHHWLGAAQLAAGHPTEARASLERALELDTSRLWARQLLESR